MATDDWGPILELRLSSSMTWKTNSRSPSLTSNDRLRTGVCAVSFGMRFVLSAVMLPNNGC